MLKKQDIEGKLPQPDIKQLWKNQPNPTTSF